MPERGRRGATKIKCKEFVAPKIFLRRPQQYIGEIEYRKCRKHDGGSEAGQTCFCTQYVYLPRVAFGRVCYRWIRGHARTPIASLMAPIIKTFINLQVYKFNA